MFRLIAFLFLSISVFCAGAQVNKDALWAVWSDEAQPDTVRLKAIDDLAWEGYLFSQPDSAYYFAGLEYELAKKKGLKKYQASALNIQGVSHKHRGNYYDALDYYIRSLKL